MLAIRPSFCVEVRRGADLQGHLMIPHVVGQRAKRNDVAILDDAVVDDVDSMADAVALRIVAELARWSPGRRPRRHAESDRDWPRG